MDLMRFIKLMNLMRFMKLMKIELSLKLGWEETRIIGILSSRPVYVVSRSMISCMTSRLSGTGCPSLIIFTSA